MLFCMSVSARPGGFAGMRHLALRVRDMARSRAFYEGLLGMRVVWEPDPDNVYLSSGSDNLALHAAGLPAGDAQRLDHLGFILQTREAVDAWQSYLEANGWPILKRVKDHRDGSRSFYVADPDGNVVQMLYEPNLSKQGTGDEK